MKLFDHRLTTIIFRMRHSTNIQSNFNLGAKMKQLNDSKRFQEALESFDKHNNKNIETLSSLIISQALKACAHTQNYQKGLNIHRLISSRINDDIYILTSLINFYMECADVKNAESVFDKSTNKALSMYGSMMKGYIKNKMAYRAIEIFKQIKDANEIILNLFFNACAETESKETLNLIKTVLKTMPVSYYSNSYLATSLLDALMKCGDVEHAQVIFHSIKNKVLPMYGAMMKGYVKNNQPNKAVELFQQIKNASEINLIVLFQACAQIRTENVLTLVKRISETMPKSYYLNSRLVTALLDVFMKFNDVQYAEIVFNKIERKAPSIYGIMMKGYIENDLSDKAIILFRDIKNPDEIIINLLFHACAQVPTEENLNLIKNVSATMPKSYNSNFRILNSLFDAFIKCKDCSSAENLFSTMERSVISYGNLMNGFNDENRPLKTISLLNQMKLENVKGDLIIYLCVIKALSQIGDNSLCKSIVNDIPDCFLSNSQIQNSLLDMWGKTGNIDEAIKVFQNMPHRDRIGFAAMINSYGLNGMGVQAIELFSQMPLELVNEITYICVLNACSHSGLVDEARSIFNRIQRKTERIYTTMVDCLSRASFFEEAENLINEYEQNNTPSLTMYMSLLSGARNANNKHVSQKMYDRMKTLYSDVKDSLIPAAILLANVYASSGDIDKSSDIRIQLNKSGSKKKVGLSWTVVDGQIYEFRAHDRSHPQTNEIYIELGRISKELLEHGHQYDSSWITRPLNAEETVESVLCGHSERLAIAWNFVVEPKRKRIQLTKNLRVCGDCHQATKLIAQIRQCEIIVRDANRIHHFYPNGKCSCNDFF